MGIKNFTRAIKTLSPNAIENVDLSSLKDSVVGVDISLSMHQVYYGIREKLTYNGKETTHIYGLYKRFEFMMKHGIKLVAVFDGKPPELKHETLKERAKVGPDRFRITDEHIKETKKLCTLMGIPIIQAKSEADIELAILYKLNKIQYILSNDSDIIIFGGMKLIRSVRNSEAMITNGDTIINEMKLLNKNFNHDSLIEIACLLGNDYNKNPKGIGVVRCINGMVKHNEMSKCLQEYGRECDLERLEISKDFFVKSTMIETIDLNNERENINFTQIDKNKLYNYLRIEMGIKNIKDINETIGTKTIKESAQVKCLC